jgi:hypothetical protein
MTKDMINLGASLQAALTTGHTEAVVECLMKIESLLPLIKQRIEYLYNPVGKPRENKETFLNLWKAAINQIGSSIRRATKELEETQQLGTWPHLQGMFPPRPRSSTSSTSERSQRGSLASSTGGRKETSGEADQAVNNEEGLDSEEEHFPELQYPSSRDGCTVSVTQEAARLREKEKQNVQSIPTHESLPPIDTAKSVVSIDSVIGGFRSSGRPEEAGNNHVPVCDMDSDPSQRGSVSSHRRTTDSQAVYRHH